jgi:hypothetical protein
MLWVFAASALFLIASRTQASPLELTLQRRTLSNQEQPGGRRLQFERGDVFMHGTLFGHYNSTKRIVVNNPENTARLTMTIIFIGKQPPENITLEGIHDFTAGNENGRVTDASGALASHIGNTFSRVQDSLTID